MKKFTQTLLALCLAVMPFLQSCDNDDYYSIGDFTPPLWATTRVTGNAFYLDCDVWGTLWPVNTSLGWFEPVEGERVITTFNPLSDNYEGYDHAVKLYSIEKVLTKQVETLTPENEEELGNDPIIVYKDFLSVSGGHLNMVFAQQVPAKEKHRISLVRPQADEDLYPEDGFVHLELRYNTFDDTTQHEAMGKVSFNLSSLKLEGTKGIKLKINSAVNGEVVAELPFAVEEK